MADLNDFNYVDDQDDVMAVYVNNLLAGTMRSEYKNVETLSADRTLLDADTPIQRIDCDGTARIVTVPIEDAVTNHPFFIINASAGDYAITLKSNDGTTILATILKGESALMLPDGDGGYQQAGGKREIDYKLTPSVASSNLTVTLTHMDGTTPSAGRPLWFKIGDAWRAVSGALSVSVTAALGDIFLWDAGKIQGNDAQIFVYMIDNNGTAQIGVSPCPMLTTVTTNYYDIGAGAQTGAAGHTNIVMSGTRDATNTCCVIGRVNVSQTDANNWQAPTATKIINSPVYSTDPMNWTPTPTALAPMTLTTPVVDEAYYSVEDWDVHYTVRVTATTATTASASIRIPVPIASSVATNFPTIGDAIVNDGGGSLSGTCAIGSGLIIVGRYDAGNFGLGAGRIVRASGEYRYA